MEDRAHHGRHRAAAKELDRLNAVIVNQQAELSNCEQEHERVAERYGETSSQALKLEKRMLSLEASIERMSRNSDDFAAALSDAEKVLDETSGSAEKAERQQRGRQRHGGRRQRCKDL